MEVRFTGTPDRLGILRRVVKALAGNDAVTANEFIYDCVILGYEPATRATLYGVTLTYNTGEV